MKTMPMTWPVAVPMAGVDHGSETACKGRVAWCAVHAGGPKRQSFISCGRTGKAAREKLCKVVPRPLSNCFALPCLIPFMDRRMLDMGVRLANCVLVFLVVTFCE